MSTNESISQASIKNENTRAIFREIASSEGISRAEISARTHLSLMTVGKVADMLIKEGIVTQAKPSTGGAGRRAGMLTVSEKHFILTIDLLDTRFRASILNLRLESIDSIIYPYNDSLFPEDNLIIFFRETSTLLLKHLMDKKNIGTGICIPGDYDEKSDTIVGNTYKHLSGLKIAETMKRSIGFAPSKIISGMTAATSSELSELPTEKKGCIISLILDGGISGCISFNGKVLPRPSDFGSLICENGKRLERNLAERSNIFDEEDFCRQLGSALRPIVSVLCPDTIFLSANEQNFTDWFPELLKNEFSRFASPPDIFFETGKKIRSNMGVAMLIRDEMIRSL